MAVTTQVVGVTTVSGLLATANRGSMSDPMPVVLYASATGVFIGGSAVSTANGLPLPANTAFALSLIQGDDIWAVGTGNINVTVLKGRS
jgi:hypothetical protein